MILQLLARFAPFLALLYALFALIQALRHKRQGLGAALLALIAVGVPLAAYVVSGEAARLRMIEFTALNAVIVFVASLIVLLIERRNPARDAAHSYGMIGVGLSILLALGMFALPMLPLPSGTNLATNTAADTTNTVADTTLRNVAAVSVATTPGAVTNPNTSAEATAEPQGNATTTVAEVLTAQTGLSADELTAQIEGGSTIAQLVEAHQGDLDTVITAIASALDEQVSASGRGGQLLSRLGTDTTDIATRFVQGTLGQAQQFLLPRLLSGTIASPQFGGQNGSGSQGGFPGAPNAPSDQDQPLVDAETTAEATTEFGGRHGDGSQGALSATPNAPVEQTQPQANVPADQSQPQATATTETAPEATVSEATTPAAPTATVARPTRIVFPTATVSEAATPTLEATEESTAESTAESSGTGAVVTGQTCALIVDYNLNLRTQPTTDGSTVLLSIPFGTSVNADLHTSDGWYHVSYDGQSGWVKGDYVTASTSCASLPSGA